MVTLCLVCGRSACTAAAMAAMARRHTCFLFRERPQRSCTCVQKCRCTQAQLGMEKSTTVHERPGVVTLYQCTHNTSNMGIVRSKLPTGTYTRGPLPRVPAPRTPTPHQPTAP